MSAPDTERWAPIPSFPAYSASTHGRIRRDATIFGGGGSVRRPSGCLRQHPLPSGHLQVTLSIDNTPTTKLVHRLVAETFLPTPPKGCDFVCHRDDKPANNFVGNLYWGTRADNTRDMLRHGGQARGERVAGSKLTEDDVRAIRVEYEAGTSQRAIAAAYGIAQSNVSLILAGRTWGHVE